MQQRSGGVYVCVSPIVFTQFYPSDKSFKRGIREKAKAKHGRGAEGWQTYCIALQQTVSYSNERRRGGEEKCVCVCACVGGWRSRKDYN